ncbi:MAG: 2,3-bisphosphoglycerate-independent phosphoglycerate mutase [Alphaproteobacteria bacterium]
MSSSNRVLLCILDGFGYREEKANNATIYATNWNNMLKKYPWTLLDASGEAVGLPNGQMGNSELGHITIGLGRVVLHDRMRMDSAIQKGILLKDKNILNFIKILRKKNGVCHLMGLLSKGGVHSHIDHLIYLANLLFKKGITVYLHAFLDGRDTAQKEAREHIEYFYKKTFHKIPIVTFMGRYYAMDRDQRWDRIEKAYKAIIEASSEYTFNYPKEAVTFFYEKSITDEFIPPSKITTYKGMKNGDGILMANFRADRVRQILDAFLLPNFHAFKRNKIVNFSSTLGISKYSSDLSPFIDAIFKNIPKNNSIGEIISQSCQKQLRIAETEKYAHVTYFFNGGIEAPFPYEDRILIPSPLVATYDLKPSMSADEITKRVLKVLKKDEYKFVVMNLANPDMVGHTGNAEAIKEAILNVDKHLKSIEKAALASGWTLIVTADHGNAEMTVYPDGTPHTSHTTSPVPFLVVNGPSCRLRHNGALSDVAPTILSLLEYEKPIEMTGSSLFVADSSYDLR